MWTREEPRASPPPAGGVGLRSLARSRSCSDRIRGSRARCSGLESLCSWRSWPSPSWRSWPDGFLSERVHPSAPMKILITDGLEPEAVVTLRKAHEVSVQELDSKALLSAIPSYHALIVRSRTKVTKDVLDRGASLKVVGRAGIGVDNIDVTAATARRIVVVNAPTASTVSVAELAVGHMLSLLRHLPEADRSVKEGKWEKPRLEGRELFGKTLGLLGSGRIGAEVVNCARGEVVQEAALADALRAKTIAGAAIDVFEREPPVGSPLLAAPNVVFTPHLGASTTEAQARAGTLIAEQVMKALGGQRPEFVVNPTVYG